MFQVNNLVDEIGLNLPDRQGQGSRHPHEEARAGVTNGFHHTQPKVYTQPLEEKSIPPELEKTLEHIVGQLDILTQVTIFVFLADFCLQNVQRVSA